MIGPEPMTLQPYFPRRPTPWLAAVALVVPGLLAAPAHAWGPEGHRIVGLVAEDLLDARHRAALDSLTGGESLAEVGLWLDRERDRLRAEHPGSERWHYDNRPVCEPAEAEPPCPDGACARHAYASALARLENHALPRAERLEALRVVVHVLADVHQPLHAADHGDRGGNDVEVRVGRRSRTKSLHAAWDGDFVKRAVRGEPESAFAAQLVADHRATLARIEQGDFAAWEAESTDLARTYAYGRLPGFACRRAVAGTVDLPPKYSDGAAEIVAERLARAGIRLAAVLRAAL